MQDTKFKIAIRHDLMNKADEEQRKLSGTGWQNVELTLDQFTDHIGKGFAFTHQFSGGHRKKEHFFGTNILVADIDGEMSVEEALANPFIKDHATFLYTTPSHSEAKHRYRIIFLLERMIFDGEGYEALYETLMTIIPTDFAVKSRAQFFFGNSDAKFHRIGRSIPDRKITEMINQGMEKRIRTVSSTPVARLTPDTTVKVKNSRIQPISALGAGTSIHCPFRIHPDDNPSAFIVINKDGIRGVQCRSCKHSAWTEKPRARDDGFGCFDRMVMEHAGQENSHFEYQGFARFDHDLETSMAKSNFWVTNSKKLSLGEILPGINLIKSPKGSGKTHALGKIISNFKNPDFQKFAKSKYQIDLKDQRVILVGHRQSLIRESAAKLGLECYLDTGDYDTTLVASQGQHSLKPQHYAICLDSLEKRVRLKYENYGVVIIDESEQVFSHFFSDHMRSPTNNFDILSHLIKRAKYVFCLDADLDTITLSGIMSCLSYSKDSQERRSTLKELGHHKNLYCHFNAYQPPERKLELFVGRNHLLDDMRKNISAGKRCYVTSNNKKLIQGLFEACSKVFEGKKFKLVVSELGDDHKNAEFLKNIKTEILNYDAVWSSPSIGTGIDITFPNEEQKIDCVYGFFDGGITTHFDIDQQLGRVRHPGAVKVWVSPKRARMSTDRDIILRELLRSDEVKGLKYYLDCEGAHATSGEHPILDLLTEVQAVRRRSINRLRDNFIAHKQKEGWKVVEVGKDHVAKERGSIISRAARAQRRKATIARLLSAADISFKEYFTIKNLKEQNKPLTDEEKASLAKYWLKKFYEREVTEELILLDDDGKTREKIALFEKVIDAALPIKSYKEIESDLSHSAVYGGNSELKNLLRPVFLRELFAIAGIFDPNTFSFNLSATYGTATLTDFINFIQKHRERLAQLFDKEINDHLTERPTVQILTLLRLVGLKQVLIKANKGGNRGGATYRIDPQVYQSLQEIVQRRSDAQRRKAAEAAELEFADEGRKPSQKREFNWRSDPRFHEEPTARLPFFEEITPSLGE